VNDDRTYAQVTRGWWWRGWIAGWFAGGFSAAAALAILFWLTGNL